tara:strand:- start:4573 stop:5286 length:714 start_codon:yes stop_codon:yes gene_type:complete
MSFAVVGAMAATAAVIKGVSGTVKMIDGAVQKKRAKEEAEAAQVELEKRKNQFANLDTTNPYLNMENTMEDLTVNQQAAEFQKQQSMQSQANILQQMRGAAGGSGIAALAQTLANQGSLDAQKAAADIGRQEARNQLSERRMAADLQSKEREGEIMSRQAEFGKVKSLMGMEADAVANAREREQMARNQIYQGVGDVAEGVTDYASAGVDYGEYGGVPGFSMKYPGGVGGTKKKKKK